MKTLIIVESPNKIKTFKKYLGSEYEIEASVGHIRDLPSDEMGLDRHLHPIYVNTNNVVIDKLKKAKARCAEVVIMTDSDREGEAIGWHLIQVLELGENYRRCATNNITEAGIMRALAKPGKINLDFVKSQEARRVLDRIIGFRVSKYTQNLLSLPSAGRVQSTALKLLVERQALIDQFSRHGYLELTSVHKNQDENGRELTWTSKLDTEDWVKSGKFDHILTPAMSVNGRISPRHFNHSGFIQTIQQEVFKRGQLIIKNYTSKPVKSKPPAPFTTSTMLQAGSSKLNMQTDRTMNLAQSLFEAGLITYHRTDATNFDAASVDLIRSYIAKLDGHSGIGPLLAPTINTFKSVEGAQEGHEAIRPTNLDLDPSLIRDYDQRNLYTLIKNRAIASQMADAEYDKSDVSLSAMFNIQGVEVIFTASGRVCTFAGWQSIYADHEDNQGNNDAKQLIPTLHKGSSVKVYNLQVDQKATKPPARYTEAALVKELEKRRIGRPSTFSSVIATLYRRMYASHKEKFITPTQSGKSLVNNLDPAFQFMNYDYTANMEHEIDKIAQGSHSYDVLITRASNDLDVELTKFIEHCKSTTILDRCPKCTEQSLVKRVSSKNLAYWNCITENCGAFFPDKNGSPNTNYTPPTRSEFSCPACNKNLMLSAKKEGQDNRYFYCVDKSCAFIAGARLLGQKLEPDFSEYKRDHSHKCPQCARNYLAQKVKTADNTSKFWVCSSRNCDTFLEDTNDQPNVKLFQERLADHELLKDCPACKTGKLKKGKSEGAQFYCTNAMKKGARQCKTFIEQDINGEPNIEKWTETQKNAPLCPKCTHKLLKSKRKPIFYCSNRSCKTFIPVNDSGKPDFSSLEESNGDNHQADCPTCKAPLAYDSELHMFECNTCHSRFNKKTDGLPDFSELQSLQNKSYI